MDHACHYWHDPFIIMSNMRHLPLIILVCALTLIAAGCTNNQTQIQPTTPPDRITTSVPVGSIETAYPPSAASEFPASSSGIQTAYPLPEGSAGTQLPIGVVPSPPTEAPEPDPGMASISGVLYSYTIKQAIAGTGFFLIPAVGPDKKDVPPIIVSPEASKGEIISRSDNSGNISIKDIPPGNYYLVVWAPMNWSVAQISEEDTNPLLLELSAGSRIPLGVIYISWP